MVEFSGNILVITKDLGYEVTSYLDRMEAAKSLLSDHICIERSRGMPVKGSQAIHINELIEDVNDKITAWLWMQKIEVQTNEREP